jgi:hypothetical protein
MGWDWAISLMPYGPTLQKHRMFLHQFLNRNVMGCHHNNLVLETHQMVLSLIDSPDKHLEHVQRYSYIQRYQTYFLRTDGRAMGAIIMMIVYGHKGISLYDQMRYIFSSCL